MRKLTGLKLRRDSTAEEKREYQREYSKLRRAEINAKQRAAYARDPKRYRTYSKKYEIANKESLRAAHRRYINSHPELLLWITAKQRAKKLKLIFSIAVSDIIIPTHCPVLGMALKRGKGRMCATSPTIDRRVPLLGYAPGNIEVISWRANCIKHNATPEELCAVAAWVSK